MFSLLILAYLTFRTENMISSALFLVTFIFIVGLETMHLGHVLLGLVLITVYIGAIVILIVFMVMYLNFRNSNEKLLKPKTLTSDILLSLSLTLLWFSSTWLYEERGKFNISDLIHGNDLIYSYLNVLIFTLITSYVIAKR